MATKIKIAQIGFRGLSTDYPVGGIEHWMSSVIFRLHTKYSFYLYPKAKYSVERKPTIDFTISPTNAIWTKNLETVTYSLLATIKATLKADIIHYHGNLPALWSFIPWMFNKKVILTLHGADWKRPKWNKCMSLVHRIALKTSLFFSNTVISVSKSLHDELAEKHNHIGFIPNGMDETPRTGKTKNINHFGFIGRLVPEKRLDLLIEAFSSNEFSDCRLYIAGDSPSTESYKAHIIASASQQENIHFLGQVSGDDKRSFFEKIDTLCIPSDIEGMPIALLEACGYRKKLVVSNIPEHKFFDEYIKSGITFFKGGCTTSLTNALKITLSQAENEELILKPDFFNKFSWNSVSTSYDKIYHDTYTN